VETLKFGSGGRNPAGRLRGRGEQRPSRRFRSGRSCPSGRPVPERPLRGSDPRLARAGAGICGGRQAAGAGVGARPRSRRAAGGRPLCRFAEDALRGAGPGGEGGGAAELAAIRGSIGNAYVALGPPGLARQHLAKALELARAAEVWPMAAALLTNLGNLDASNIAASRKQMAAIFGSLWRPAQCRAPQGRCRSRFSGQEGPLARTITDSRV
jgi:hypothetical protein